jgi:hypothetical protein
VTTIEVSVCSVAREGLCGNWEKKSAAGFVAGEQFAVHLPVFMG